MFLCSTDLEYLPAVIGLVLLIVSRSYENRVFPAD